MAKKLLYLNVWDDQEFKEPWRQKAEQLERKVRGYDDFREKFEDMEKITSQLLQNGQDAVELFGWSLPAVPSFIKSKVGKKGHVYSIDAEPGSECALFLNFIAMYESFNRIQSGLEIGTHYHNSGTPLKYIGNGDYILQLEKAFDGVDIERAKNLKTDSHKPEAKEELTKIARQFYDLIGIENINQLLPPYPEKLGDESIDAVFEHNGFPFCLEEQKEGIVAGADRILKPGGYIVFKDIPRELVAAQYYGEQIFGSYTPVLSTGLNYPHEWLVLRKER